jgi:hypothetical protein
VGGIQSEKSLRLLLRIPRYLRDLGPYRGEHLAGVAGPKPPAVCFFVMR